MSVKHGIHISVVDAEGDTIRDNSFFEEDVESIGGVGAIVETIEALTREGECIEVSPMYYE